MTWMLLTVLFLPGCTAARASYFLLDAQQKYQDALSEGAEKHAPYEITLAREYLQKAKEEDGYSDFGATETLAKKSMEYSASAYQRAVDISDEVKDADTFVPEEKREEQKQEQDDTKIDLDDL